MAFASAIPRLRRGSSAYKASILSSARMISAANSNSLPVFMRAKKRTILLMSSVSLTVRAAGCRRAAGTFLCIAAAAPRPACAAPREDGDHQGGDHQQQDDEGGQIHGALHKDSRDQVGQQGDDPGHGTLEHNHPAGLFAAELALDGRDGGHAGRIEQAER